MLFSIPLILGNLLKQTYSTVDSIIAGNVVGKNTPAAVGASTSLVYLLIAFSQGAAVGAGVVVSQYLGARKKSGCASNQQKYEPSLYVAAHTICLNLYSAKVLQALFFSPSSPAQAS